jgi:hypothetical protein
MKWHKTKFFLLKDVVYNPKTENICAKKTKDIICADNIPNASDQTIMISESFNGVQNPLATSDCGYT